MASLVLTRPGWPHPLAAYAQELARGLQDLGVALFSAPLQRFLSQPLQPEQRVRWLSCLQKSASPRVWLVSTSPSAAYAFVQQPELLRDLQKARNGGRLVISGIGRASMLPLIRWAEQSGHAVDVIAPASIQAGLVSGGSDPSVATKLTVSSADASAYLRWAASQSISTDTIVLLEASQNRDDLADGLTPLCHQVLRLPIYRREPLPMPVFSPKPSDPVFVLVTSSSLVDPAIEGFEHQGLLPSSAIWLAHHPAIVQAIRTRLPTAECLHVDGLEVDKIVDRIKLRL